MWCCPKCLSPVVFSDPHRPWPPHSACDTCGFAAPLVDGIPCLAPELADSPLGSDLQHFSTLVKFEQSNFWFVNRARLITALIQKHFPRACDFFGIGRGTGSVLLALRTALPQLILAGSDLHSCGLAFARERLGPGVALLQMDARRIAARGQFDVIGAFDVIEHVAEDEQVLSEIFAALKPGGGTIIAVPQHPWLWSPEDDAAFHQRRYERGELESKLQKAGFRVWNSTSFNCMLVPLTVASRLVMILRARHGIGHEPLAELKIGDQLNRALSSVLRLEVILTCGGLRWLVGGSRFVVAQRP